MNIDTHLKEENKKMKPEEEENVQVVTTRLVDGCLNLKAVIKTFPEGEDVERLRKAKAIIEEGLVVLLLLLEAQGND